MERVDTAAWIDKAGRIDVPKGIEIPPGIKIQSGMEVLVWDGSAGGDRSLCVDKGAVGDIDVCRGRNAGKHRRT